MLEKMHDDKYGDARPRGKRELVQLSVSYSWFDRLLPHVSKAICTTPSKCNLNCNAFALFELVPKMPVKTDENNVIIASVNVIYWWTMHA